MRMKFAPLLNLIFYLTNCPTHTQKISVSLGHHTELNFHLHIGAGSHVLQTNLMHLTAHVSI